MALFAALSYAITQSGRGSGGTTRENEMIAAAQVTQYAAQMQQVVTRLKMINGCSDTQINFVNTIDTNYNNTTAPSDGSCNVFDATGGGMDFRTMPAGTGTSGGYSVILGSARMDNTGSDSVPQLIFYVPVHTLGLCQRINASLGLPATLAIDHMGVASDINTRKFKGTYTSSNLMPDDGGNEAGFAGTTAGCFQARTAYYPQQSGYGYFYYHILIER